MEQEVKQNFYFLSKEYKVLYDLLCEGYEIAAFVDYQFKSLEGKYPPSRDICRVRRRSEYDIDFGARGISYGSVSSYFKDKKTEFELFLSECERMNVEWIEK
jgi:hypothetical protein